MMEPGPRLGLNCVAVSKSFMEALRLLGPRLQSVT